MILENIVAHYATKENKVVSIDLKALSQDEMFREEVVKKVLNIVKSHPHACVLIPAHKPFAETDYLGQLINDIILSLQVDALVTGSVENLKKLQHSVKEVLVIKQSFRTGEHLAKDIATLKKFGCKVKVLCLIAHSSGKLQAFGYQNQVEIDALVKTDKIAYL